MAASSDTLHASRLATGDWVVLRRPDDGPLGFLGKVTDGEWDPRDDALLRARVDTTRSKPVWFAAGDLERVSPSDEAALVEAALARGLVPPERAARLRADVEALRDRRLTFVRSPGLLDRLWAALPAAPEQRSGGLAAFFDEGQRALHDARQPAPTTAEVVVASAPAAAPPVLPVDFEIELPDPGPARGSSPGPVLSGPGWRRRPELPDPASLPVAATRPSSRREAVARILDSLGGTLQGLVGRLERLDLRTSTSSHESIRDALLAADLQLPTLLDAVSPRRLRQLPPLLGLPHVPELADRTIQAWILATFRDAPASPPSTPEPLAPLPRWREPLLPRSEVEAKWRVLRLVRGRDLEGVRERAGVTLSEGSRSPRELCLAIATSTRRDLKRLLFALPNAALVHAPWVLGLPPIVGARDALVEELVGRWPPMTAAGPVRVLDLDDLLLPHVARALTVAELTLALLNIRSLAPVDPPGLVATLRAEGHDVRHLLSHLGPGALRRVATACGVPDAIEDPEALHAAILSFEPFPFA